MRDLRKNSRTAKTPILRSIFRIYGRVAVNATLLLYHECLLVVILSDGYCAMIYF